MGKWDGKSEDQVTAEVVAQLKHSGFYECASTAALPSVAAQDAVLEQTRGWFFKTQLRKIADIDTGTFRRAQHQSAGIPDLFIRDRDWPLGLWLGIELKGRKRAPELRREQKLLKRDGCIFIAQSAVEVMALIEETTRAAREKQS